jgi:hypothetical protein
MDDAPCVRMLQSLTELIPNAQGLLQRQAVVLGLPDEPLDVASGHVLTDDVGLAGLLADVVDRHDVGVIAEPPHGLRLTADPRETLRVEPIGLDEGEGHISIETHVAVARSEHSAQAHGRTRHSRAVLGDSRFYSSDIESRLPGTSCTFRRTSLCPGSRSRSLDTASLTPTPPCERVAARRFP